MSRDPLREIGLRVLLTAPVHFHQRRQTFTSRDCDAYLDAIAGLVAQLRHFGFDALATFIEVPFEAERRACASMKSTRLRSLSMPTHVYLFRFIPFVALVLLAFPLAKALAGKRDRDR